MGDRRLPSALPSGRGKLGPAPSARCYRLSAPPPAPFSWGLARPLASLRKRQRAAASRRDPEEACRDYAAGAALGHARRRCARRAGAALGPCPPPAAAFRLPAHRGPIAEVGGGAPAVPCISFCLRPPAFGFFPPGFVQLPPLRVVSRRPRTCGFGPPSSFWRLAFILGRLYPVPVCPTDNLFLKKNKGFYPRGIRMFKLETSAATASWRREGNGQLNIFDLRLKTTGDPACRGDGDARINLMRSQALILVLLDRFSRFKFLSGVK